MAIFRLKFILSKNNKNDIKWNIHFVEIVG
jgi:hypothetical protein